MEPEELWAALPGELHDEIDAWLVEGHFVRAIMALREKSGITPTPGINDGKGLVGYRTSVLHERGLLKPPPEQTVDGMLADLAERGLDAVAVEITWDGDSRGWHTELCVVVAQPRFHLVALGRFFPHVARTEPVRDEAMRKGRALAERLGVPFHFPLPDAPDTDQPHWWEHG
ncbi:hypothetical protein M8542_16120 [Amycolatopsis sp. OK19-0408]|uniref:Uncharacterized protein n=1 Tax=Amycolatopsis iheyensis TaxID=2945988 RepID=A0A9X2NGN7_9PSEU|nr:hypothetical protein [Amycolatopsis iheyensis]MCR6484350.1 hypothetical protein [Amycolatopsis iheyensis]